MEKFFFEESRFFSVEVATLLKHTVFIVPNWKWIVLVVAWLVGAFLRPLVQFILKEIKKHNPFLKRYPRSFTSYYFQAELERPSAWILIILFWFGINDAIDLGGKFETYYEHILKALLAIHIIRLVYYAVDALGHVFADLAAKTDNSMDDQLVPFASKSLKALVVILGLLIVLQSFGLNVMSLLAGLGLGGLALALAAQDTAANLFGSVTILIDTPCKIGDWVKVKDIEGTVEEIGFRSTRIRTFYNSVITIPNATMAKETIDNMGMRSSRRIRQVLSVTYETSPAVIENFCKRLTDLIKADPKADPGSAVVTFNGFAESGLNVLVQFNLIVDNGNEETEHQQRMFLNILNLAAEMKVDFAYPTRTLLFDKGQALTPALT